MRFILTFVLTLFVSPAFAQTSHLYANSPIKCTHLAGLQKVGDKATQAGQMAPLLGGAPWEELFNGNGQCTWNWRPFSNQPDANSQAGFKGWIVTNRWLIAVERIVYLDEALELAWRPGAIFDRKRHRLSRRCMSLTQQVGGARIYGHNYDVRGARWRCALPLLISN